MHFIPSCAEFISETHRERQAWPKLYDVFDEPSAEQGAPIERCRRWIVQEAARATQEGRQTGEGHLSELAECYLFIGLEALKPDTGGKLVSPFGERDLVRVSEKISGDVKIAPVIASCQSQLRLWVGRLTASDHNRSHGESG